MVEAVICSNPALYAVTVEENKKVQETKDKLLVKASERSGELDSFPTSATEFLYSIAQIFHNCLLVPHFLCKLLAHDRKKR